MSARSYALHNVCPQLSFLFQSVSQPDELAEAVDLLKAMTYCLDSTDVIGRPITVYISLSFELIDPALA